MSTNNDMEISMLDRAIKFAKQNCFETVERLQTNIHKNKEGEAEK